MSFFDVYCHYYSSKSPESEIIKHEVKKIEK